MTQNVHINISIELKAAQNNIHSFQSQSLILNYITAAYDVLKINCICFLTTHTCRSLFNKSLFADHKAKCFSVNKMHCNTELVQW